MMIEILTYVIERVKRTFVTNLPYPFKIIMNEFQLPYVI